jgi:hypothetical protein
VETLRTVPTVIASAATVEDVDEGEESKASEMGDRVA